MALENRFRFDELVTQGSKAIVSEDPTTKNHTFVDGSSIIVSASQDVPYEHKQGERDGEVTAFIEKPAYTEEELIKAVDVDIDELVKPQGPPRPDVVPRPVYDELQDKYEQAIEDLEAAQQRILLLEGQVAELTAQLQAALVENDALQVQKAVVDNQYQQATERYKEQTSKLTFAVIKATKEANARVQLNAQVEGLVAQKDVLRQQLLSLRQVVAGLEGQVEGGIAALKAATDAAQRDREAAEQLREQERQIEEDRRAAVESQLAGAAAETAAAAAGLIPLSDNESYYGIKSDTAAAPADIKWQTKAKNGPLPGKAGTLEVQNLKDSGAKITKVQILGLTTASGRGGNGSQSISGNYFGFSNDNSPSSSINVTINKGAKQAIPVYFKKGIGGENSPKPKSNRLAKTWTYTGNFSVQVTYDDGSTAKSGKLTAVVVKTPK